MIHMICGSTGAGKSTFANKLATEEKALRFSIDEWMLNLFMPDAESPDLDWMLSRIDRCEMQIMELIKQQKLLSQSVILDLGLSKKSHREKFYRLAEQENTDIRLYYLDVPADERWNRVQSRNKDESITYKHHITREMFDFMEAWFEAPQESELVKRNGKVIK